MKNRWRVRVMKHLLADQPRSVGDGDPPSEVDDPFEAPNASRRPSAGFRSISSPLAAALGQRGRW